MIAYRLCRRPYAALDGEGARLFGGRWNPKGVPMVYAASSISLAVLETLVHVTSVRLLPKDYVSLAIDIPDALPIERWEPTSLPAGWDATPAIDALGQRGSQWVAEARSVAVFVPSAVVPSEWNVLINPRHPDASRVALGRPEPFRFDERLKP